MLESRWDVETGNKDWNILRIWSFEHNAKGRNDGWCGDHDWRAMDERCENLRMEDPETHNQKYTSHASRDEVHTHLNGILLMQPTKFNFNAEKFVI